MQNWSTFETPYVKNSVNVYDFNQIKGPEKNYLSLDL